MNQQHSEEDIQKMLKMLEETEPEKATREDALKILDNMRNLASKTLDQIDDDLKSGKTKVEDDGTVTRSDESQDGN
jgi:hypothetical protein